jgi:Arc/MetJ-type ribon-helix-helix transcriptional regulator
MKYPIFKKIIVTLTDEQDAWLNKEMDKRGLSSKSDIIQEAIELLRKQSLAQTKKQRETSG